MAQSRHLGTVHVRDHDVRFVLDNYARGGCYSPELHIYLSGPNGSSAGRGPKGWPLWLSDRFRAYYHRKGRGSSMLVVRVPHIRWRYVRNPWLRKAWSPLYRANSRLMRRIVG